MSDFITKLRAFDRPAQRMCKTLQADGEWSGYGRSKNFKVFPAEVGSIHDLYAELQAMQDDPWLCIIRGRARDNVTPETRPELFHEKLPAYAQRSLQVFRDTPHHWVCMDVDHFSGSIDPLRDPAGAVQEAIEALLPFEFHHASHVWQLSNSAGFKPGLRAHIWFWLSEAQSSVVLKHWAAAKAPRIDRALFNPVQVHYTAAPVIEADVPDPVSQRMGLTLGILSDEVDIEIPEDVGELDALVDIDASGIDNPPDPREKISYVGAFCRAWPIERVLDELLPDVFVPQDDRPNRLTYLLAEGGGAGGAFITSDGLHIVNKHNSDPFFNRAANAFDLVRHYLHNGDNDDLEKPVNQRDSYHEMLGWCLEEESTQAEVNRMPGVELSRAEDDFEPLEDAPAAAAAVDFSAEHERVEKLIATRGAFMAAVQHSETHTGFGHFEVWQAEQIPDEIGHLFQRNSQGGVKNSVDNMTMVMAVDQHLRRCIGRDEFAQRRGLYGRLPWRGAGQITPVSPGMWRDDDYARLRAYTIDKYQFTPTDQMMADALDVAAGWANFHPVRTALDALEWDGTARLDSWLTDYCHVEDSRYTRAVAARTLIGAVRRVFEPGCKHDTILVLEGKQGLFKSTAVEILAGSSDWYREGVPDMSDEKKLIESIRGHWLIELPELSSLSRSSINEAKETITRRVDKARLAYGREETTLPRQSIFIGTTNNSDYLRDSTGNRRFWPVTVGGPIAVDELRKMRDQIMAEAVYRYRQGERNYIGTEETELQAEAQAMQDQRYDESPQEERIQQWLDGELEGEGFDAIDDESRDAQGRKIYVSPEEIIADCFGQNSFSMRTGDLRVLRQAIKRFFERSPDWDDAKRQVRVGTNRRRVYVRVGALDSINGPLH